MTATVFTLLILKIYVAEPSPSNELLDSLLGRDALDQFVMYFDQRARILTLWDLAVITWRPEERAFYRLAVCSVRSLRAVTEENLHLVCYEPLVLNDS